MTDAQHEQDPEELAAAEAQVARVRARAALREAPETAARLRQLAIPADGRTEAGELPEWRTPLITGAADAADAIFLTLRDWVEVWAARLEVAPDVPAAWVGADGTPRGLRAGLSPERVSLTVTRVAGWLLWQEDPIAGLPGARVFHDAVAAVVWSSRWAAGLGSQKVRSSRPRVCPVCGEQAVRGTFFGEPLVAAQLRGERVVPYARRDEAPERALLEFVDAAAGVAVRCEHCGWTAGGDPVTLARWLAGDRSKAGPVVPGAGEEQ